MGKKLRLVGCERYNFRGELYVKTGEDGKRKVYYVGDNKAAIMLRVEDSFGRPYFAEYVPPTRNREDVIAAAAAEAAAKAARDFEAGEVPIDRPDGSEPDLDDVPVVDPEAAIEVDTDDDPELDNEDAPNAEEIDPDAEDRDDGTAVEV